MNQSIYKHRVVSYLGGIVVDILYRLAVVITLELKFAVAIFLRFPSLNLLYMSHVVHVFLFHLKPSVKGHWSESGPNRLAKITTDVKKVASPMSMRKRLREIVQCDRDKLFLVLSSFQKLLAHM